MQLVEAYVFIVVATIHWNINITAEILNFSKKILNVKWEALTTMKVKFMASRIGHYVVW